MQLLLDPQSVPMSMAIRYVVTDGLVRSDRSDCATIDLPDPFDFVQYVQSKKQGTSVRSGVLVLLFSDVLGLFECYRARRCCSIVIFIPFIFYCNSSNIIATMLEDQKLNMFILPLIHR